MNCPCHGCTKRWVSDDSRCHSSCEEYKDWTELNNHKKDTLTKHKAGFYAAGDVLFGHRRKN